MTDKQTFLASATVTVDAPRGDVWALWVDVNGWPNWNGGVTSSRLVGRFQPQASISLDLTDGTSAEATLVSVGQGEEFADETVASFGAIRNRHRMKSAGTLLQITHETEAVVDGDAVEAFLEKVWPTLQTNVAESLSELADLAQS